MAVYFLGPMEDKVGSGIWLPSGETPGPGKNIKMWVSVALEVGSSGRASSASSRSKHSYPFLLTTPPHPCLEACVQDLLAR